MPAGHLNISLCVFNFVQLLYDMKQGCDPCDTPARKCKLDYKNWCDSINSRSSSEAFLAPLFTVHNQKEKKLSQI